MLLLFSCSDREKNVLNGQPVSEDSSAAKNERPISREIHCLIRGENKYCLVSKDSGSANKLFIASPDLSLRIYKKVLNGWIVEAEHPILKEEFYYCELAKDFELASIEGEDYLYFVYSLTSMGNATTYTELHFSLFSLKDHKQTVLLYGGDPVYNSKGEFLSVKGEYINVAQLTSKTALLDFIQKKISSSPLVYNYSEEDLDMCRAKNYRQRLAMDNEDIAAITKQMKKSQAKMIITYYDESIFPVNESEISNTIENDDFKVVALFRNDVLAYDKNKKKYFPVWVEECTHGCDKNISFNDKQELEIAYTETEADKIIVDLSTMTYKMRPNL